MTKSFRTAAVVTMVAALATSSIFAQSSGTESGEKKVQELPENAPRMNMPLPFHNFHAPNAINEGKNVVIGQISSVDSSKSLVKVKNADGKDVEIHVSPFTRIMISDSEARADLMQARKEMQNPENMQNSNDSKKDARGFQRGKGRPERVQFTISDLKKGSWVMVGTYETNTKTLEASVVRAEQKLAKVSDTVDAK
ncbi:hypothetical protein [Treponema zioleckii]|uniref:hypothetical protein n=1 Tax=Treponema zioleckii TaxID=331680 RepID=UPI00168ADDE2|nr:hypothetical protein [Treponema zioleckii]